MKITSEISLRNFEFWSGAKDNADKLTCEQLDKVEQYMESIDEDGWSDTSVNDLFWFDFETILSWLNLDEECREIGSDEWLHAVLQKYADGSDAISQIGNPENIIESFIEEDNYVYSDEGIVIKYFEQYMLEKWKSIVANQLSSWHKEVDLGDIEDWLDDNYTEVKDITSMEEVEELYDKYLSEEESEQ